jgi:1-deoxy-D-xylulose-5-phosphate synthase
MRPDTLDHWRAALGAWRASVRRTANGPQDCLIPGIPPANTRAGDAMTSPADSFPSPMGDFASSGHAATPTADASANILETIRHPSQIRALTIPQLERLATEVRERIISVIASKGGHFGAPLGAVDLTVACMKVFSPPEDRIVWDTGHQAYAWKILTGRNERFDTIRQYKGLSGFLKRTESEYDAFGAGHASTSIAAAVGMALGRDLTGGTNKVVAIIGDGAMTGGLAYEALNNAGLRKTDMIVILNDNEMSISENVWVVHKVLSNLITQPAYNKLKRDVSSVLAKVPFGDNLKEIVHRVEGSMKGLIAPGMFFEQLGFRYIGPVDGHNLEELVPVLEKTRDLKGPILLHVITKKGKGYKYAEADPIKYHAAQNMKIETGEMANPKAPPAFTRIFGQTLTDLARHDRRIVAITAAMPQGTGTDIFAREHPERFYDIGIAEGAGVDIAAGLACEGLKPFVAIYSTFLQRAIDQIVHDCALQHLPVRFVMDRGGLVGADGPTHHGVLDFAYMRMIPEMIVMAPKDEQELRQMTRTMAEYDKGPSAMRYPRGNSSGKYDLDSLEYPALPIGVAETVQQGKAVALIAIGLMVQHAIEAAAHLEKALGHPVTVINARWVKPLDKAMLREVAASHEHLFTIEDHSVVGGFGSAVNEALVELKAPRMATVFGVPDRFVDHGTPKELYTEIGLMPDQIAARVLREIGKQAAP